MTVLDWNTLLIVASVFATGGMGAFWLENRFRNIERIFYKELNEHKKDDDTTFKDHAIRIQRLELKEFGFTKTP